MREGKIMVVSYRIGIKRPCGWRQETVKATVERVSDKMVRVVSADIEQHNGAKRQSFYAPLWERGEIGKMKRLSACRILEE